MSVVASRIRHAALFLAFGLASTGQAGDGRIVTGSYQSQVNLRCPHPHVECYGQARSDLFKQRAREDAEEQCQSPVERVSDWSYICFCDRTAMRHYGQSAQFECQ